MASNQNNPDPAIPPDQQFESEVGKKEERKIKARQKSEQSIWFGLGMMGMVGWSVAVPTLLGIAVGIWLDSIIESRRSFTLMGMFLGLILGCWNEWYWVNRQSRRD